MLGALNRRVSLRVSLPLAGGRDLLHLTPTVAAGSGFLGRLLDQMIAHDLPCPKACFGSQGHTRSLAQHILAHTGHIDRSKLVSKEGQEPQDMVVRFLRLARIASQERVESAKPRITNEINAKSRAARLTCN